MDETVGQCNGSSEFLDIALVRNILDSMSDSLVVLGPQGEVVYANRATHSTLGYSLADIREHGLGLLFFPNEKNASFNQIFVDAAVHKNINQYTEVQYHHPDGSIRELAVTTSYLRDDRHADQAYIGFVALFKDITEVSTLRRRAEQWTLEKERIAREKARSLETLAMGVAHEIRNPVVSIGGFASRILRASGHDQKQRTYAQNILVSARRLEEMVAHVNQYCNLPEFRPVKADLGSHIAASVAEFVASRPGRSIPVRVTDSLPQEIEPVIDPTILNMVLQRLLENAVEFSPEESPIVVEFGMRDECLLIMVQDHGRGITEENLPFVFNPFFSTKATGTGMGMAIAQRLVQEHLGRMELDSQVGRGTTVSLLLPVSPHQ